MTAAPPDPADFIRQLQSGDQTLDPYAVAIARSSVDAYEHALGLPCQLERMVPEPLLIATGIAAFDRSFGRVPGTLHIGQSLHMIRPIQVEETFLVIGAIDQGKASRRGHRFVVSFNGLVEGGIVAFAGVMQGMVLT